MNTEMQTDKILEGNKLIDEFMGIKVSFKGGYSPTEYHSSWNLLMPVVEKIAKIEIEDNNVVNNGEDSYFDTSYPRTFGMIDAETKEFMVRINRFPLHKSSELIEATWFAVVEFIEYINKK